MNDPQIWTLIAVFAAAMLGGFTLVITSLSRVIRAEVGGLRSEVRGDAAGLNARFDALERRIDHIDRDVQGIIDRMWRGERDG